MYRFERTPGPLRDPVLIAAFDAWVDAGGAATGAAAHVARGGEVLARFDVDPLLDFRTRRPILDVVDGELKELAWPEITVTLLRAESRDVLVLTGPEPDHRWRAFADAVLGLARELGVGQLIALGAIPAATAHTRPVPLIATATPPDQLRPDDRRPEGLLRVPAAALSVVQKTFAEAGIPIVGFFAQIPHYVTAAYTAGVVALVQRLARYLQVDFPLGSLPDEVRQQRAQLDAIVASRPDVQRHVEQLEEITPEGTMPSGGVVPSGEDIAAEIEKFLRRTRGDG